MDKNVLKLL